MELIRSMLLRFAWRYHILAFHYLVYLGDSLVCQKSKKHRVVTRSSGSLVSIHGVYRSGEGRVGIFPDGFQNGGDFPILHAEKRIYMDEQFCSHVTNDKSYAAYGISFVLFLYFI